MQEKSTFFRKDAQRYSFFLIYANFWRQKSQKKKKADGNSGNRDAGHMTACEKGTKDGISYPPCMADAKKGNAEHTKERGQKKKGNAEHTEERGQKKKG